MTFEEAYYIQGQPVPENLINAEINAAYDPFLHTPGYLLGYPGYPTYQNIPLAPPIRKDNLHVSIKEIKEEKKKRRRKRLLKLMILSQMMNNNN